MEEQKIQEFIGKSNRFTMTKKHLDLHSNAISETKVQVISFEEKQLRDFLIDNRDEEIAILKVKIFTYEQIISNSNFAPIIKFKEDKRSNFMPDLEFKRIYAALIRGGSPSLTGHDLSLEQLGKLLPFASTEYAEVLRNRSSEFLITKTI